MDLPPSIPGPRLGPFNDGKPAELEFIELIAKAGHSYVWKVSLDGKIYVLKIFIFMTYRSLACFSWKGSTRAEDEAKAGLKIDDLVQEEDPFFAECRAYGRLKETNNEYMTAKCYGYPMISKKHEKWLTREGADFHRWAADPQGISLRGIVKEYIELPEPFTRRMVPRMMRELKEYHRIGVLNEDLRGENYRQGMMVDFSSSFTSPSVQKNGIWARRDYVKPMVLIEYATLDSIVDDWNKVNKPRIWHRMVPGDRVKNLRNYNYNKDLPIKYYPCDFD